MKHYNEVKVSVLVYLAFGLFLLAAKLFLIHEYGNATPYWDQWDAEAENLYKPFLEGTLSWGDLFVPHNEHRIFTTRILGLGLLIINGIWNPLLQMVVNAVLHIAVIGFCISLLTRVVGRNYLPGLLAFSLVLFGFPYAWENTLAGFQSQFYFVLLFGIACLWFTITSNPFSVRWWGGVICAMLAFLSLASGIFALASAAITSFVLYVTGLRKTRNQLLAAAILGGLFILGAAMTPSLAHHASLKAASFPQFFLALKVVLGWPISLKFWSVIIRNLPAFYFLGLMFYKRPPVDDRKWFLFALVVWALGQSVSIAYGRAIGNLSSRYLDLFAICILINFACLILIAQRHIRQRYFWVVGGVSIWAITILLFLGQYVAESSLPALIEKRNTGLAQELNVKNYLATDDFSHLTNKPYLHVPYPNSERLASILSSSRIRSILPANIRGPLPFSVIESEPVGAFVPDGYYPTTPKRTGTAIGSYGAHGDAEIGNVKIYYDNSISGGFVEIPISGYPMRDGIKVEIVQNDRLYPVALNKDPRESWQLAYAKVKPGPFVIQLSDFSAKAWLAIGTLSVVGPLDYISNRLLANYAVFAVFGLLAMLMIFLQSGLSINLESSDGWKV